MASLSIADMSPRLALQRILALFERGEQREAAAFLHRLSLTTFRQILPDLPTDLFVESLPQSLPVLEALYAKLFLAGGKQLPAALSVSPETVIWQLVKFFACQVTLLIILDRKSVGDQLHKIVLFGCKVSECEVPGVRTPGHLGIAGTDIKGVVLDQLLTF